MTAVAEKIPIVYHPAYNISFFGLENVLHSFDSKKYGRIFQKLTERFHLLPEAIHSPQAVSREDLLQVHTSKYLDSLQSSFNVARIAEVPLLAMFPNFILQTRLLHPMRLATGGTILAVQLALEKGWAVNLSGGYHHAKASEGGGFCFYVDIPLAIHKVQVKTLIVDLDAHQGNGLITTFVLRTPSGVSEPITYTQSDQVAILDVYNQDNYPGDTFAKQFIRYDNGIAGGTGDEAYLTTVRAALIDAMSSFRPQLVIYNAGTDIYCNDSLGDLNVSAQGIIARDELVFQCCKDERVPIAMVLSGGYSQESAGIIVDSLSNLHAKGLINLNSSG